MIQEFDTIISQEVDTFFQEKKNTVSISIIDISVYPFSYYLNRDYNEDFKSDASVAFSQQYTNLIQSKFKNSLYSAIITTHYFDYIVRHFQNNEEQIRLFLEDILRTDIVIFTYHEKNNLVSKFFSIIESIEHEKIALKNKMCGFWIFREGTNDSQPLMLQPFKLRTVKEFELLSKMIDCGFAIPSNSCMTIQHHPEKYIKDVIERTLNGTEFYNNERLAVYHKIMKCLHSMFSFYQINR